MMRDSVQNRDAAKQQMAVWYSHHPTLALMGEFSSGKSTLLNVLLGRSILPAKVTATKLPVIWITYDTVPSCHGLTHEGQLSELDGLTPDPAEWEKYLLVRMALDAPVLQLCDVIDTPGISDPRLSAGSLRFIADFVDFAVWCTAANQAWRQSEKAAWSSLPIELRQHSILAVTRADTLESDNDITKVIKRMSTETNGLFRDICPIASLQAMKAASDGKVSDPQAWQDSGAHALMQSIKTSIKFAEAACTTRETLNDVAETMSVGGEEPANQVLNEDVSDEVANNIISVCHDAIARAEKDGSKNTILATIQQLRDVLLRDFTLDGAHADVLAKCLRVDNSDKLEFSRILKQVEQDIEDFAKGAWCRLDEARADRTLTR